MNTLIELYDERPFENVLATDVFHPEHTIFLCTDTVSEDNTITNQIKSYFYDRGFTGTLEFRPVDLYSSVAVADELHRIIQNHPDCALDITGGTDAALYACGLFSSGNPLPVFTWSRKKSRFFNIHNADFADNRRCALRYTIRDFIRMAGGDIRIGRVDNTILKNYSELFSPFFSLYLKYRTEWTSLIGYIQHASQVPKGTEIPLTVQTEWSVKGERNSRYTCNLPAMQDLQEIGLLHSLNAIENGPVSFSFTDRQVRSWLRDVGSVLELYVYKTCLSLNRFREVRTSVVIDWEQNSLRDRVSNEIDVCCIAGVTPLFISCKTCDINTEALNELAVLRDRFGGKMANAAVISASHVQNVTRNRAHELDIDVIDLSDLENGRLRKRISALLRKR